LTSRGFLWWSDISTNENGTFISTKGDANPVVSYLGESVPIDRVIGVVIDISS